MKLICRLFILDVICVHIRTLYILYLLVNILGRIGDTANTIRAIDPVLVGH